MTNPQRGEIWLVDLDPTRGQDSQKIGTDTRCHNAGTARWLGYLYRLCALMGDRIALRSRSFISFLNSPKQQ